MAVFNLGHRQLKIFQNKRSLYLDFDIRKNPIRIDRDPFALCAIQCSQNQHSIS